MNKLSFILLVVMCTAVFGNRACEDPNQERKCIKSNHGYVYASCKDSGRGICRFYCNEVGPTPCSNPMANRALLQNVNLLANAFGNVFGSAMSLPITLPLSVGVGGVTGFFNSLRNPFGYYPPVIAPPAQTPPSTVPPVAAPPTTTSSSTTSTTTATTTTATTTTPSTTTATTLAP